MYLNEQTIVDETVEIIGMLSNPSGSTLKDIAGVMKMLHGPVRQELIQDGLVVAELSGIIECKNRRYKVRTQRNISGRDAFVDVPGCSSWGAGGMTRDSDSCSEQSSVSSLYTQVAKYLEADTDRPPSDYYSGTDKSSVKTIQSSDQLSFSSCPTDFRSEGSETELKGLGKMKNICKKRLITSHKDHSTVEKDTKNVGENLHECQPEIKKEIKTQDSFQDNDDSSSLRKNGDKKLPAKRSMNDVMNDVMKRFLEHENPINSQDCKKEVLNKKENKSNGTHNTMTTEMTEVVKKLNTLIQSDNPKAPVISNRVSKKEESSDVGSSLDGAISDVKKRLSGADKQESRIPAVLESNCMFLCDDESKIKTARRSVETEPRDMLPSCSAHKIPKLAKREIKIKQENYSDNVVGCNRYLTRSNELKRSCLQSQSDTSMKRVKLS